MSFIDLFWFSLIPLGGILFCYHFADLSSAHSAGQFFISLIVWFLTGWFFVYIMLKYVLPMLIDLLDRLFPMRPKCMQCGSRGKDYSGRFYIWSKCNKVNLKNPIESNKCWLPVQINHSEYKKRFCIERFGGIIGVLWQCKCGKQYFENDLNRFYIVISGDLENGYLVKPWKRRIAYMFWVDDPGEEVIAPHQIYQPLSEIIIDLHGDRFGEIVYFVPKDN